ncbi:hypothetical protein PPERSA_06098 [Pseudocohnilembus persalinus]|uniref:Uncharacterized protein n=1 Tax=Pseudocohnilembus persalinus TaxID=266149 RepID=A0A0V0QW98_PSEPJ|nr:hypothetical protein PPERSA_06098 [Pseudocohnilembus persalinus]|eukprot:KRX06216.1 hypothetical protein PPERSA_06098 [Pseudocohnilembus persalinus]
MFNYDNILNQQQIKLINQDKPDSQSTEISIKNFLYKFDFPDIELFNNGQHRLVLKKYVAELDIGTFGLKWQPIDLVFTIDDFLLIFEKNEKIMPSKIKMDCNNIQFQKRNKNNKQGNLCYIIEKNPGTFYNSNQKVLIRFKDYDQLLEFQIYLKRYGVDSSNIETILE